MTDAQLYLVIGVPAIFNAVLVGLLMAYINAKFDGHSQSVNQRFESLDQRFENINQRFESIDQRFENIDRRFDDINRRFDEMRDLWRSELHREMSLTPASSI